MNAMKKYIKQSTGLTLDQIEKGWKKIPKEKVVEPEQTFTKIPTGVDVKEVESARKDMKKALSSLISSLSSLSSMHDAAPKQSVEASISMLKAALNDIEFRLDYEWKE
jgi:hypothetical protein